MTPLQEKEILQTVKKMKEKLDLLESDNSSLQEDKKYLEHEIEKYQQYTEELEEEKEELENRHFNADMEKKINLALTIALFVLIGFEVILIIF